MRPGSLLMHTDRNSILGTTGKITAYISAFAAGALALCFFSYLQKLLVGYPQHGIGYIVPVLAGGSVGMYIKVLYVRLHNLEASTRPTAKPERLIHRVAYFITCMISGSVVLSMFLHHPEDPGRVPTQARGICHASIIRWGYRFGPGSLPAPQPPAGHSAD